MIVACTSCQKKLRVNSAKYAGKNLRINCPYCQTVLKIKAPPPVKILVAHGEPEVCRSILEVCRLDVGEILTCSDAGMARKLLARHRICVLLLDVALPGAFPFQLIEEIREAGEDMKIVLLPSVYNRTAYKRTPSSLYGADGYVELHHLSDRLIPLLQNLLPDLALKSSPYCLSREEGQERALSEDQDLAQQARELARLLIADIALYHQEQIDQGILHQDLEARLAVQLEEGRRLLAGRIPQAELERKDYLLEALNYFAGARELELQAGGEDSHG